MKLTRAQVQFPGEEPAELDFEIKHRWGQPYVEIHLEPELLGAGESVTFTMDWTWDESE